MILGLEILKYLNNNVCKVIKKCLFNLKYYFDVWYFLYLCYISNGKFDDIRIWKFKWNNFLKFWLLEWEFENFKLFY